MIRSFSLFTGSLLFAQSVFPATAHARKGHLLAENGTTAYVITVAEDAIAPEKTAARELKHYLESITGADFPIVTPAEVDATAPQIIVGAGQQAHKLLPEKTWQAVGKDGIVIKSQGNRLVLAGNRPRGTLYAVYEFLENNTGIRWWAPGATTIPKQPLLKISAQDIVYTPPFSYREHYSHGPSRPGDDPVFATILRENGHYQTQSEEWGGHYSILGFVHTFSRLLPPDVYFKDHPEWYSDPANKGAPCTAQSKMPVGDTFQLCFSSPGILEEATRNALKWIDKNPAAGYISLSEADVAPYCQCADCRAFAAREGSEAGIIVDFVNKIAAKIGEKYPHFLVETLAYHGSEKPPKTIRPAKNVIVRMAPIDTDYGHPVNSEENKAVRDNLKGWSKIAQHLFIWNYETNFTYLLMPHPNWNDIGNDLRFFASHNVKGFYQQGNHYTNGAGDFVEMRAWLAGKLMWNPGQDQAALMSTFLEGYYGKAAPFLQKYIDLVLKSYHATSKPLGCFNPDFSYLTLDVMNEATRLFGAAEKAIGDDPVLRERLGRTRVSLDMAWLQCYRSLKADAQKRNAVFLGPEDLVTGIEAFRTTAARYGIAKAGENYTLEARLEQIANPKEPKK